MTLTILEKDTFQGLSSVIDLDVSSSNVRKVGLGAFDGLQLLRLLNISNNDINTFTKVDFDQLQLDFLHADDYKFCCIVGLEGEKCLPAKDELSSCEDLMSNATLRTFLWLLGCTALLGNLFVFMWRSVQGENLVSGFLVKYLALADFLMGVYMVGIASVDVHYQGTYIEHASDVEEKLAVPVVWGDIYHVKRSICVHPVCNYCGQADQYYSPLL